MDRKKTYSVDFSIDGTDIHTTMSGFKSVELLKIHSPVFIKQELINKGFCDGEYDVDIVISDSDGEYVDSDSCVVKLEKGEISISSN